MKNAIVFSIEKRLLAVELRWVREVITLGHVTPVPNAPPVISGVVNFGGAIIPVVEVSEHLEMMVAVDDLELVRVLGVRTDDHVWVAPRVADVRPQLCEQVVGNDVGVEWMRA